MKTESVLSASSNLSSTTREWLALLLIAIAIVFGSVVASAASSGTSLGHQVAEPADPLKVLGNAACVKCHASEQAIWTATPHARTFDELHRRPEASQIASKLGLDSIKHGQRCVACHYTQQPAHAGTTGDAVTLTSLPGRAGHVMEFHVVAGVSCESCHGAARDWLDAHHDYGSPDVTRLTESADRRATRIARSVELGMRNPHNVYLVAQSCYRCHTTGDEELVNIGGHPAGSLDFEFVSWNQGTIHHNFATTDGKQNVASTPHRLRFMFLAGVIADTEAAFRAVATATVKENYAITVAKRAARAGARLKSVADKVADPRLTEAVALFDSVQIKLNNAAQLESAADKLAGIGYELAEAETKADERQLHEKLISLDRFIPDRKSWK